MMLRPYQLECIERSIAELQQGVYRQLVSLPVGSGKTTVFAHLLRDVPQPTALATKTLVLAHREELIDQAAQRIMHVNPHLVVDVEQGERHVSMLADVLVASVPTVGRSASNRLLKYDPALFKCIVVDEAHHATAASYLRTLDHFGVRQPDSRVLLWGCSATPRRFDGVGLNAVFDKIVYHRSMIDMMRDRWLCPVRVVSIATKVDLSSVRVSSAGAAVTGSSERDFAVAQLARVINTHARNRIVVDMWKDLAYRHGRKSSLVFAVNVDHINALVNEFRAHGIDAASIDGHTSRDDRASVLQRFRRGELPVLVNCGVLTEGTDVPSIDCIVMARPTRSTVLFQQMLGRGLRLHTGKGDCLVLDFVDSFAGKSLVTVPSLLGLDPEFLMEGDNILTIYDRMRDATQRTGLAASAKSLDEAMQRVASVREIDPFAQPAHDPTSVQLSPYAWVRLNENEFVLDLGHHGILRVARNTTTGFWELFRRLRVQKSILTPPSRLPAQAESLEHIFQAANTYLATHAKGYQTTLLRTARWRQAPASQSQLSYLRRLGVSRFKTDDEITRLTKGEAQRLITLIAFGVGKKAPTLSETQGRVLKSIIDS